MASARESVHKKYRIDSLRSHTVGTINEYNSMFNNIEELVSGLFDISRLSELSSSDLITYAGQGAVNKYNLHTSFILKQKGTSTVLAKSFFTKDDLVKVGLIDYYPFSIDTLQGKISEIRCNNTFILMLCVLGLMIRQSVSNKLFISDDVVGYLLEGSNVVSIEGDRVFLDINQEHLVSIKTVIEFAIEDEISVVAT